MKNKQLINLIFIFSSIILFAQNNTIYPNLLETNFHQDNNPKNINKLNNNKLIFNTNYGIAIKEDTNKNSRLLIRISNEYNSFVNENITYKYNAAKAQGLTVINNIAYFFVKKNSKLGFFKTDGTDSGTKLIYEFAIYDDINIDKIYKVNQNLIFSLFIGGSSNKSELWTSDGTTSGTKLIFSKTSSGSSIYNYKATDFINLNGITLFKYYDENNKSKIWKTDGSVTGTQILFDSITDNYELSSNLIFLNNEIYFIKKKNNKNQLCKYNLQTNSFIDIRDLTSVLPQSNYLFLTNNKIYFSSNDYKLWESNGTFEGTFKVSDTNNLNYFISDTNFASLDNKLYFTGYNNDFSKYGLYFYDNISVNFLSDYIPNLYGCNLSTVSNDKDFMLLSDYNQNYYIFNGTIAKKINNLKFDYNSSYSAEILSMSNNEFLINAADLKYGQEIFKYNFISEEVSNFDNGNSEGGSYFYSAQILNNKLFYFGTDEYGTGPYLSDGITTNRINTDIKVQLSSGSTWVKNISTIRQNNKIFFPCYKNSSNLQLCVSDGSKNGTDILKIINPSGDGIDFLYPYFMNLGSNKFLFTGKVNGDSKIWISDGTEIGTYNLNIDVPVSNKYATLNNKTYFTAYNNNTSNYYLKSTDGTNLGTIPFYDNLINSKKNIEVLGQTENLFFILVQKQLDYWTSKLELWSSDGTETGTIKIKTFSDPHYSNPGFNNKTTVNNGKLYFFACAENPNDLTLHSAYVSDGTISGTYKISNIEFPNGTTPIHPYLSSYVKNCGEDVYFVNNPNYTGVSSLWIYKNNEFSNIYSNPDNDITSFAPNNLTCINNNLLFVNKLFGTKIWYTNGTKLGTKILDLFANNLYQNESIYNLTNLGDKLFISSSFKDFDNFNSFGQEIYVSNINSSILLNVQNIFNSNNSLNVIIYPNPTSGIINISTEKSNLIQNIKLLSLDGKLIYKKDAIKNSNNKLNLDDLSKGIYILFIQTENGIITKKIIKK